MNDATNDELDGSVPDPADGSGDADTSDVPEVVDPLSAMLGGGSGGGLDLGAMMQAAQSMQAEMESAQHRLADARVVGTAGGELVSVTLNGHLHLLEVDIDPVAIDPDDPSILEDLIRAAWQAAHDQVAVLQRQADPMSGLLGGAGGSEGGLLGGLGDLLGGM